MNRLSQLFIWAMILLSCNFTQPRDEVKDFIPGLYATQWKNEFTESTDTIMIFAPTNKTSDVYRISKRSFYQQTIEGKALKPQYKIQEWQGRYNADVKTLVIEKSGRVLFFKPETNALVEGSTNYRKIK